MYTARLCVINQYIYADIKDNSVLCMEDMLYSYFVYISNIYGYYTL